MPILDIAYFTNPFTHEYRAPATDQSDLNLSQRTCFTRSLQSNASCHDITDHLAMPIAAPGEPHSHLWKRVLTFVLVGS